MEAYLDNSATTVPCEEAIEAVKDALQRVWGNPSSLHHAGLEAEHLLQACREELAGKLGCSSAEIIFTSGGTEANNLAIFGAAMAQRRRGRRIVTSAIEHSSIAESTSELQNRGFEVVYLGVDSAGRVPEQELVRAVNKETILVSLMAVNNEVGAIQPIDAIRRTVRQAGAPALIHCDAVQAFGKLPIFPQRMGVDLLTVSSHKVHGPKGAGALYIRKGAHINPILFGGSQEQKKRPGTEAMPAIAGFAAAVRAMPDPQLSLSHAEALRERLVHGLQTMEGVKLNSPPDALPYLTNISVPGLQSEPMLNYLSQRKVYVSSGSACSKGKKSRVLRAMGLSEADIAGALRISLSRYTTWEEIDAFLFALNDARLKLARR